MPIPIANVQFDAPKPTGIPIANVKFDAPPAPEPTPFSMEGAVSGDMSSNAEASQAVTAVASGLNPLVPAVTGLAGLAGAVAGAPWRKGGETATKWMEAVQPYITVPLPKTKAAQDLSTQAGAPFEFIHNTWGNVGDQFVDHPIIAASIATIGEVLTYAVLGKIAKGMKEKNMPFNPDYVAGELTKEIVKNAPKDLAAGDRVNVSGQEYEVRGVTAEGATLVNVDENANHGSVVNVAPGDRFKSSSGEVYKVPTPAETAVSTDGAPAPQPERPTRSAFPESQVPDLKTAENDIAVVTSDLAEYSQEAADLRDKGAEPRSNPDLKLLLDKVTQSRTSLDALETRKVELAKLETPVAPTEGAPPAPVEVTPPEPLAILGNESGQAQILNDAAKAFLESDTVKAAAELHSDFKSAVAPYSVGEGKVAAGIVREKGAAEHVAREQLAQKFEKLGSIFKNVADDVRLRFIDAVETGVSTGSASVDSAFKVMSDYRETLWKKIQDMQGTDAFIEHYFPHFWEDPDMAAKVLGRRPLAGSGSFLKERTVPTVKEGMAKGLKLKSTNPVELEALKIQEMLRFIKGQEIFTEFKDRGLARFVKFGGDVPEGFSKINDKIAKVLQYSEAEKGMILRGEYYAPDAAATILNNYLSPGLSGNLAYNIFRGVGNFMNQVQLGMSAFHFTFTAFDAITSQFALGITELSRGQFGDSAKHIATAVVPGAAPLSVYIKGSRFLKGALEADPAFAEHLQALIEGGGRLKMDSFYKNSSVDNFWKAMDSKKYGSAAWSGVPALIQTLAKPVMEHWVPRMKLGLFTEMVESQNKFWEKQGHIPGIAERRAVYGKMVDSVDNRMGQMNYDNLFWNKNLKDVGMASTRSLGWNIGTLRELGGGLRDIFNFKDIKANGISSRTAYVVALPAVIGIYGAMYQYLKTGEGPSSVKDLYFPRTGNKTPDGRDERVSIPSYVKDVYSYAHDLPDSTITTLGHKLHPILAMISQLRDNRDYYGVMIKNSEDPAVKQMADTALFMLKQFVPFSFSMGSKRVDPDLWNRTESFFGIGPAPKALTQTPGEVILDQITANHHESGAITREEWLHNAAKKDLMGLLKSRESGNLSAVALENGIQPGELAGLIRNSNKPHEVVQLIKATPREAMMFWRAADAAERKTTYAVIVRKLASNKALSPQDRGAYMTELRNGR